MCDQAKVLNVVRAASNFYDDLIRRAITLEDIRKLYNAKEIIMHIGTYDELMQLTRDTEFKDKLRRMSDILRGMENRR